jgi:acylphosphatase
MRRVHLIVYGRVQGVFFRHNTKKIADKLNLKGWVRNNPDDTVEIVAEGNDDAIDKLINWCRKGPIGAKVEKVEIKENGFRNEFKNFSIVY